MSQIDAVTGIYSIAVCSYCTLCHELANCSVPTWPLQFQKIECLNVPKVKKEVGRWSGHFFLCTSAVVQRCTRIQVTGSDFKVENPYCALVLLLVSCFRLNNCELYKLFESVLRYFCICVSHVQHCDAHKCIISLNIINWYYNAVQM